MNGLILQFSALNSILQMIVTIILTLIITAGIILACAMCAMAHRFLKWRIEIFSMRHNGAQIFVTAHKQNLDAP